MTEAAFQFLILCCVLGAARVGEYIWGASLEAWAAYKDGTLSIKNIIKHISAKKFGIVFASVILLRYMVALIDIPMGNQ